MQKRLPLNPKWLSAVTGIFGAGVRQKQRREYCTKTVASPFERRRKLNEFRLNFRVDFPEVHQRVRGGP
jgi:hypothetical protein